jgi:TIR domain
VPSDTFSYDLFISYAREDRPFARELVKWLRSTQIRVWVDEEQLVPGSRWRAGLQQGIKDSRHLLALLTPAYVTRAWTQREIDLFDLTAAHDERRLLAVELGALPNSQMDQIFEVTQRIQWPSAEFNGDGFWCLHCGLHNLAPGPREEWNRRGRELLARVAPSNIAATSSLDYFLITNPGFKPYRQILTVAFEAAENPKSSLIEHFRTLRELVPPPERDGLLELVRALWAYGFAEAAAMLVITALPNQHRERSPWPFIDLNCQTVADWFLLGTSLTEISTLLKERGTTPKKREHVAEIWFSWAIFTRNWNLLPICAELSSSYVSESLSLLAEAASDRAESFDIVESKFDYGKLATPWNHFHLMWLAVRLNRHDAALLYATKLCSTTSVGEVRTGRFLNRLLHWPLFSELRKQLIPEIEKARRRLKLTSIKASTNFSEELKDLWEYAVSREQA